MRALALSWLALVATPSGAADPVPAAEVARALDETARAVADVVLDDHGRARGDYDWLSGEWREYEAAWHTGQAIEALVAAHGVTGDAAAAVRAFINDLT